MAVEHWSEQVDVIRMNDEESLGEELATVERQAATGKRDVILDFSPVKFVNSSQIGKLLKIRKQLIGHGRKMILTGLQTNVWGALMVMGLDQILVCSDDVATALASLQLK